MQQGQYVVVRADRAGVHVGELVSQQGNEVTLKDARRIWSWKGANTLHEIAIAGVAKGSCVSVAVPSIDITEWIEIIETSKAGETNLRGASWGK